MHVHKNSEPVYPKTPKEMLHIFYNLWEKIENDRESKKTLLFSQHCGSDANRIGSSSYKHFTCP